MSKHTPGPWRYEKGVFNSNKPGVDQVGSVVAHDPGDPDFPWFIAAVEADLENCGEELANAQLIAAAPDLLEAAKFMVGDTDRGVNMAFDKLRDAIDKAEGR